MHIDIVILSETWFCGESVRGVVGYNVYHSYREDRRGGGVPVFVSDSLISVCNSQLSFVTPFTEFCTDVTLFSRQSLSIVDLYRSPCGSVPFILLICCSSC